MSIKAISWGWQNSAQKGGALLVELAIADFADDEGRAWPAIETLAIKARMTPRNVNHIIERKLKPGGLKIIPGGGRHKTNVFKLPIPGNFTLKSFQGNERNPETGFLKTLKPISPDPSLNRHKDIPALKRSASSISKKRRSAVPADPRQLAAFNQFYATFPRRVSRADAEKAWLEINPDSELTARIMKAVRAYADSVQDVEPRFIKHPGAWLRAKRWEDELSANSGNGHAKPVIVKTDEESQCFVLADGSRIAISTYRRIYGG